MSPYTTPTLPIISAQNVVRPFAFAGVAPRRAAATVVMGDVIFAANAAPQYNTAARAYNSAVRNGPFPALLGRRSSIHRRHDVRIRPFKICQFFQYLVGSDHHRAPHTATCVPTSTTRPVGMWKKSVASLADFARPMNNRSCQRGIAECEAGLSARRDRKNDVDMMSKCQPCLRATASAFGTFGDSI